MSTHLLEEQRRNAIKDLTAEQLQDAIAELQTITESLDFENNMFEKFLISMVGNVEIPPMPEDEHYNTIYHYEPNHTGMVDVAYALLNSHKGLGGGINMNLSGYGGQSQSSKRSKATSISSSAAGNHPTGLPAMLSKLTAEQKCDIAMKEIEDINNEMAKVKNESERKLDNDRAYIEELEMKQKDISKAHTDFERDMKNSINERTKKYHAEKVQRYFEEKKRAKEALVKKLRLKTDSMAGQKKKVSLQLKQKEEMGEVLHEVDFNQLKIENQQYLEKIDDKNKELLDLKSKATNTTVYLNGKKTKMQELTSKILATNQDIKLRTDTYNRLCLEMEKVKKEEQEARQQLNKLKGRLEDYEVPATKEYILQKCKVDELRQKVKTWHRKVEISEMKLRTVRSNWKVLCNKQNMSDDQMNEVGDSIGVIEANCRSPSNLSSVVQTVQ